MFDTSSMCNSQTEAVASALHTINDHQFIPTQFHHQNDHYDSTQMQQQAYQQPAVSEFQQPSQQSVPSRHAFVAASENYPSQKRQRLNVQSNSDTTGMPFGKLPVLEVDGKVIHQSTAICRYLGKKLGLAGGIDDWEALEIDAVADTIVDLRTAIVDYSFYTEESEKPKKKETLLKTIPFYLTRLDRLVKDNDGHFVRGKLSYADIIFVSLEEFLSGCMESDLLEGYPNLKTVVEKVNSIPGIQAWISKRPKTQY